MYRKTKKTPEIDTIVSVILQRGDQTGSSYVSPNIKIRHPPYQGSPTLTPERTRNIATCWHQYDYQIKTYPRWISVCSQPAEPFQINISTIYSHISPVPSLRSSVVWPEMSSVFDSHLHKHFIAWKCKKSIRKEISIWNFADLFLDIWYVVVDDDAGEVFWYDLWIDLTSDLSRHRSLSTWQMTLITYALIEKNPEHKYRWIDARL